jgi:hypothetical protein
MAGFCIVRFDGGGCLIKEVIEGHIPEVGKHLPDAYREGFDEVVIGVFDETSQAAKLLRLVKQLDGFDINSNEIFTDALMEVVREVGKNECELEGSKR